MKLNPFRRKRRGAHEAPAPKIVESGWRPPTVSVLETPRDRFLRERAHRRKAINRTKNKLAHAARRENWHG